MTRAALARQLFRTAATCPSCGRILFPTREGNWPFHRNVKWRNTVVWCTSSDEPLLAVTV